MMKENYLPAIHLTITQQNESAASTFSLFQGCSKHLDVLPGSECTFPPVAKNTTGTAIT